jgi:PTH1 family peptidyl-tRNA hydrolase
LSKRPRPDDPELRLIAGLGNPGDEYTDTPHNLGFAVLDELARRAGVDFRRGPKPKMESVKLAAEAAVLLKPQSFMNLSGQPVQQALNWFSLLPAQLIVVCDDVNLPLGSLRIRKSGGAGGQKGLKSIINQLHTEEFPRVRIGVSGGHPGADVGAHVLSKFRGERLQAAREMAQKAADAVECVLREGIDAAMNRYNSNSE